ncbi:MAG: hypothetical protein AB7O47_00670 [Flavobacteriales bacterium]
MQQIKLIWNFSGPDAEGIAKHHEIHIREFLEKNNFADLITGVDYQNEIYWSAYLIVNQTDMIFFRDKLKPHKGELVD